jgi:hypothetical protein
VSSESTKSNSGQPASSLAASHAVPSAVGPFEALVALAARGDASHVRALRELARSVSRDEDEQQALALKLWAGAVCASTLVRRLATHSPALEGAIERAARLEALPDVTRAEGDRQLRAYAIATLRNLRRDSRRRASARLETLEEPLAIERAAAVSPVEPSSLAQLWHMVMNEITRDAPEVVSALEQVVELAAGQVDMATLIEAELDDCAPEQRHDVDARRRARDRLHKRHSRARASIAEAVARLARDGTIGTEEASDLDRLLARLCRRQMRLAHPSGSKGT